METQSENNKMNRTKLKLLDLNPHLMCVLCGGYYIDATTIVECLHSFCRSCIVKHLESSKYCPICEVQVHKTKPLINIRPDKTLQDIVYKLVPGLYASEMKNRRKFYKERPHYMKPSDSESVGEVSDETMFSINEYITLSLSYHNSPRQWNLEDGFQEISPPIKEEKRFLKCPTGVTIYHLQKLLKAKYDLNDNNYKVELLYKDQPLHKDFTLLDIAYIYLSKNNGTLDLSFKIYESVIKRQKIDIKAEPEVSVEQETKHKSETKSPEAESQPTEILNQNKAQTTEPTPPVKVKLEDSKPEDTVADGKPSSAQPQDVKENGVNNSESKEVMLQISEAGVMSVSEVENSEILRTVEETTPKNLNKQSNTGITTPKENKIKSEVDNKEKLSRLLPEQSKSPPKPVKQYKTIRCSPKTWHPVITKEKLRPTLMKNSDEPKKPAKFFKARNVPRFLGNPSSGVKPMYADSPGNQKIEIKKEEKKPTDHTKTLKKILKIDPKTLRPIEKDEIPIVQTQNAPNLLTNPFIPNNNHFLFSDPQLLPPNSGNFSNFSKSDVKCNEKSPGSSKSPLPNGSYTPLRFPSPDYPTNLYPYPANFAKLPFPVNDKMDPFNRAARFAHFSNITGFNVAGYHPSLPPSISLLFNPHHHIKKLNPVNEKSVSSKEESTKETNRNCDDNSLKVNKKNEFVNKNNCKDESKKIEMNKINKNVAGDSKMNQDGNSKTNHNNNNNEKSKDKCKNEERKVDKMQEKKVKIEVRKEKIEDKREKTEHKKEKTENIKEKIEDKKDKIEVKKDKIEDKKNKIEDKKDQIEDKKDKIENKKDKIEDEKDEIEDKKDKIEDKKDKIEDKNRKAEDKKEKTEEKNEKVEDKKEKPIIEQEIQNKSEKIENKFEKFEGIKGKIEEKKGKPEEKKEKIEERKEKIEEKDKKDTDIIEKKVENCNKLVDDCKSNSSACNDETKSETLNNDNKSVNDKKR